MAYVRKTVDEFDIEMLGCEGWEVVTCEPNRQLARQAIKDYRVNAPEYQYRIKHRRVKIEA